MPNQRQILAEFNLTRLTQLPQFKDAYRELRTTVDNLDRAYRRLVRGETTSNRRPAQESTLASPQSSQEIAESS